MSRNRIFVLTDAGLITVVIGLSVSPILIVIRELLQEEHRAVYDPQIRATTSPGCKLGIPKGRP